MIKKIVIILSILAIAISLACLVYLFLWPKQQLNNNEPQPIVYEELTTDLDTTDWQEYKNDEWGLSFKYPGDWTLHQGLVTINLMPKKCPYDPQVNIVAVIINLPYRDSDTEAQINRYLSYARSFPHSDIYKKSGQYKFIEVSTEYGEKKGVRVVAEYNSILSEILVHDSCYSLADTMKQIEATFTTLKFY